MRAAQEQRVLASQAGLDLPREDIHTARIHQLRHRSRREALDDHVHHASCVCEDGTRVRRRMVVNVVGAADSELHGKESYRGSDFRWIRWWQK